MNSIKSHYKYIVIGAGAGGLTCSLSLATADQDVLLLESNHIGGECTHTGCVPSKALIDYAQKHPGVGLKRALQEVRTIRQHFVLEESPHAIQNKYNIDIAIGYAHFIDSKTILVDDLLITFNYCVIATGAQTFVPSITGLESESYVTHETFFELTREVQGLTIIGGGYVGCEIANACANLGVNVTIIQRNKVLIPHESQSAQQLLYDDLVAKGVRIYLDADTTSVESGKVYINQGGTKITIAHDQLLIATGKAAKLEGLHLETATIRYNDTGIIVDHRNRTNHKHILAIGDCVADNPKFTHRADHEAINVFKYLYRRILASRSYRHQAMPSTIYTDLQISRVGMTLAEISDTMQDYYHIISLPRDQNDKSIITQTTQGYMTIIFTRLTGVIVGAEVVGVDTAEILTLLTYLVQHEKRAYGVTSQIYQYPVRSHLIKKICGQFIIHTVQHRTSDLKRWLLANLFRIIAGVLWGALLVAYFVIKSRLGLTNNEIGQNLIQFFSGSMYGGILFIVLYAIRPLTFFPAIIMTLMGGVLFGPIWGIVYTFIGENASASFAYWIGRGLGRTATPNKTGMIALIKSKMTGNDILSVVIIRLIPLNFDLVNYSLGIIGIKYMPYVIGTALGVIPAMTAIVLAGASFSPVDGDLSFDSFSLDTSYLIIAIGLYVLTIGITYLVKKRYNI